MWNNTKVIDVHGHMSTPYNFLNHIANIVSSNTAREFMGMKDESLEETLSWHLGLMNDRNIDFQLIGPRPINQWHWVEPHIQVAWSTSVNNVIAQSVRLHPDRFAGMAQLPQNAFIDTTNCLKEFERCVKELGFVGAYVNPDPSGTREAPGMADEYWFPLYEMSQELDAPLMVHPSTTFDRRLAVVPQNYQTNNVTEEYIATQILQHGKVFERFPRLKVCVCHCGGGLNRFVQEDTSHVSHHDLSKNLFFDLCAYDRDFLATAIKQRGVNQCCFGTESPGAGMGTMRKDTGKPSDDLVPVIDDIDFLTDADKVKIFNTNPLKVFTKVAPLVGEKVPV